MSGFDDLFGEAAENASQDSFTDASWGAEVKLAENERWAGRYRGEDVTSFNNEERRVHLLEELDGTPLFIRGRSKLDRQFDKAKPNPGDTVAIVRLDDVALDERQHDARLRRRGETRRRTTAREAGPARRHPVLERCSRPTVAVRTTSVRTRSSRPVAPCVGVTGFESRSPPGWAATRSRRRTGSATLAARRRASRGRDLQGVGCGHATA